MTILETYVGGITAEPQPLLANTSGTLLFEVRDRDETRWTLVTVDKGRVSVEPLAGAREADATVSGELPLLEAIAQGKANAMASMLRGELHVEGDSELLMVFQRIFPGPNDPRRPSHE